jgi:hypothetical protein
MRLGYSPTQGFNLFQNNTKKKLIKKTMVRTIPGKTKRGGKRKAKRCTDSRAQKQGSYLTPKEKAILLMTPLMSFAWKS